jgi:hypothetical protein
VTDIHETLDFGPEQCGQYGRQPGIWSLEVKKKKKKGLMLPLIFLIRAGWEILHYM